MTIISETIVQQSNAIGLSVLNRDTAEKIGQVKELWLDPIEHRIMGSKPDLNSTEADLESQVEEAVKPQTPEL